MTPKLVNRDYNRNRQEFSNNSLSFPGVSYNIRSRKYRALIMINGKSKHLGYFKTPNEAFAAYRNANLALFGAFPPSVTRDEFKAWSDRVETLKLIYLGRELYPCLGMLKVC